MSAPPAGAAIVRRLGHLRGGAERGRKLLLRASVGLAVMSLVGYGLSFVRDLVVTGSFGLGADLDAYLLAITIPTIVVGIIGGTIDSTVIPIYVELRVRDPAEAGRFANTLLTYALLVSLVVSGVLFALAMPALGLLASTLDVGRLRETERLFVWYLPFIPFSILAYVLRSLLNAHHRFVLPALGPALAAGVAIVSVFALQPWLGVGCLLVGGVAGAAVQGVMLVPLLRREQAALRAGFALTPEFKRFLRLALPLLGGSIFSAANLAVDRFMAAGLPPGRIASLNYADRFVQVIAGTLVVTATTVALPRLSELVTRGDFAGYLAMLRRDSWRLAAIMVPITLVMLVLAQPIIQMLFERGKFDHTATVLTAQALAAYAVGLLPYALAHYAVRALLALQLTGIVSALGVVNIILNVAYNLLLIGPLGHVGIALGTSLMYTTTTGLVFWLLRRAVARRQAAGVGGP